MIDKNRAVSNLKERISEELYKMKNFDRQREQEITVHKKAGWLLRGCFLAGDR